MTVLRMVREEESQVQWVAWSVSKKLKVIIMFMG